MAASLRLAATQNSCGTPLRADAIGVVLAHERAVAGLDLRVGGVGRNAKDRIGAARIVDVGGADGEVFAAVDAEDRGHILEEAVLGRMQDAVGRRDVEQASEHRRQEHGLVLEQPGDAGRVHLVAGDVALGEVVDAAHVLGLVRGDLEQPLERLRLDGERNAVGLGHLGGERRHRDGEGDGAVCGRALPLAPEAELRPKRGERGAEASAGGRFEDVTRGLAWGLHRHVPPISAFVGNLKMAQALLRESCGSFRGISGQLPENLRRFGRWRGDGPLVDERAPGR